MIRCINKADLLVELELNNLYSIYTFIISNQSYDYVIKSFKMSVTQVSCFK